MQLTSNADENYRFHLYLEKTYKKTASLIANSCKAVRFVSCPRGVGHMPYPLHNNYSLQVTILSEADGALAESAYAFGRHLGMAFQLLDDVLDFVGQEDKLGKPAGGSDLQLGLATGPVLFAAQQVRLLFSLNHPKLLLVVDFKACKSHYSVLHTFVRIVGYHVSFRFLSKYHPS